MSGRRRHAFVTLLTSNHYLPGALTLVSSLTDVERDRDLFDTVCIVTVPNVSHDAVAALHRSFDVVVGVDTILSPSTANLELLGESDLTLNLALGALTDPRVRPQGPIRVTYKAARLPTDAVRARHLPRRRHARAQATLTPLHERA